VRKGTSSLQLDLRIRVLAQLWCLSDGVEMVPVRKAAPVMPITWATRTVTGTSLGMNGIDISSSRLRRVEMIVILLVPNALDAGRGS
jgi:hypothetical protein